MMHHFTRAPHTPIARGNERERERDGERDETATKLTPETSSGFTKYYHQCTIPKETIEASFLFVEKHISLII